MTTPATTPALIDLTWVEFSEEQTPSCATTREECSREATWYGIFKPGIIDCNIYRPEVPYCESHKEEIQASIELEGHARFACMTYHTHGCAEFVRWERIKR